MRKTLLTALSALALLAGSAAVTGSADAAAKPAYKVTLNTSVAKSEAGRFITVAGKVTGPKAAGKTVLIQRHYVGTGWVNVTTAVIKPSGRYAARVETPRGGTTSFRAVKAASTVRKAGASPQRSIPVYEWLYLSHQNGQYGADITPGIANTTGGKSYPRSIVFWEDDSVTYKVGGLCTAATTQLDYKTSNAPGAMSANFAFATTPGGGMPYTTTTKQLIENVPSTLTVGVAGARYLQLSASAVDATYNLYAGDPKVYCNASALPSWGNGDF